MKRIFLISLALFGTVLFAGGPQWETDMAKAKAQAKKEGKSILINFSGSDWCSWCIRLDQEVFNKKEFVKFAEKNLVLLNLDFPRRKQLPAEQISHNRQLQYRYGVRGFPTVLLVDAEEKLLLSTGYRRGGAVPYVAFLKDALPKSRQNL